MKKYQRYFGINEIKEGWNIISSEPMSKEKAHDDGFGATTTTEVVATVTGPRAREMALNASGFKNSYAKEFYEVEEN